MIPPKQYVREDAHGALRVGDTRISLDSVVYAFQAGHSPETIMQQYPALSLEEIYGSITYYLANRAEVEAYLARQDSLWEEFRRKVEQHPNPVMERLRALKKSAQQEAR
jgi:uncharacterized protein (DUF433 family)